MFVEEHDAKQLIHAGGIGIPLGRIATRPEDAADAAADLGPVMVKAQVPSGKRGKAGGIIAADSPQEAAAAATRLLGSSVAGFVVERVLVEGRADIAQELYVAVTIDPSLGAPVLIVSTEGGMDIEEVHATAPDRVVMTPLDILAGLDAATAMRVAGATGLATDSQAALAGLLLTLYGLFRRYDAELLEINPLALTEAGELVALDAKLVVDDNAKYRQGELPDERPVGTPLERQAREQGFLYVELEGDVGVLANGAGLTMSTRIARSLRYWSPTSVIVSVVVPA